MATDQCSCAKSHRPKGRPLSLGAGVFIFALLLAAGCSEQLTTSPPSEESDARPSFNLSPGDGPIIGTDRQDYALGESVVILGWGWTAGEVVYLQVVHAEDGGDDDAPEHQPWNATADAGGEISSSWVIPFDGDEGGATLKLTADEEASGAHAEVLFTDLFGTVALYSDAPGATSQTAYPWGATIYPRITGATSSTCYRLRWMNPSSTAVQTTTAVAGAATYDAPTFTVPATGPSGTWSLIADQNPGGNCGGPFTQATNSINFDVARAVVVGAGTSASDGTGGDHCVYLGSAPPGSGCGTATDATFWVRTSSAGNARAFVRFDLSAASPAAVPAGVVVTDAKVRLTVAGTPSSQRTYDIQRAASTWAEGTITYATQPVTVGPVNSASVLTTLVAGAGGGDPQTWVKWGVTANVQTFVDDATTNHGWRISDSSEGAATAVSARFHTTEGVCVGGTTCKRVWPVLLIDYTDPPKLVFTTTAKTGEVGQCLGPIRVQSQDFSGSPLVVSANTTVNLSTANLGVGPDYGIPGEGSFYSDASCATGTTTALIANGDSYSSYFYYRATHRGDGTHDVVAHADGYTPDATQTQTVNRATTVLTYTGDLIVLIGNTLHMSAKLQSAFAGCVYDEIPALAPNGKRIIWGMTPDPNGAGNAPDPTPPSSFVFFTNSYTNASGVASRDVSTSGWDEGIYDGRASFPGDDDCDASKDDPALTVLSPGNAATGGGFLAGQKVGGGRANFGFNVRPVENTDPTEYRGQFLLNKTDEFRCKGSLDTYGVLTTDAGLNAASGRCDFQVWNPALDGGNGGWEVPAGDGYTNRPFTIYFRDNGQGRGNNAPPPDQFGFTINYIGAVADPSFAIADINGGNIDVKGDGGSTTTITKESATKPGGGKKK